MAIASSMYIKNMIFLTFLYVFGYVQSTHAWWTHEDQCPSENPVTHECYQLIEEHQHCMAYIVDCCDSDTDDGYHGYCKICMKLATRPCVRYLCISKGCCDGWHENQDGKCTIPQPEDEIQCKNGGFRTGNNTCWCPENFTGNKCHIPICNPICENEGRCETVNEKPTCICPSRYIKGNHCEEVSCEHECLNGGYCIKDGVIARCQCAEEYRGSSCEVLTSSTCPIMTEDLKMSACSGEVNECLSDTDCQKDRVCCWDGCAGVCKKPEVVTCHHHNKTFSVGEVYKPHPCTICLCQPLGNMKCDMMECEDFTCPGGHLPLQVEGQCCKRCPGTDPPILPQEPVFLNCPRHYIEADVEKTTDIATLPELHLLAKDYAGFDLRVTYSQTRFLHSRVSDIRTNTHIVMAYSEADRYGRRAECQIKVIVRDKYSPKFSSCPYDQWAEDYEKVSWHPPVPSDNVGIFRLMVVGDDYYNKTLPAGVYAVSYTALDFDQNQAICSFIIHVYENIVIFNRVGEFIDEMVNLHTDRRHTCLNHSASENRKELHWPTIYDNYRDDFPSGTIVGISTGFVLVLFFTVWVCVRVRQNRLAEAEDRAMETNTIASTADTGATSTVFAMCGRVADMYNTNDITMKDIKLPEYSPAVDPPAYEELAKSGMGWGHSASLPIYEEIPEREGSEVNLVHEPEYENIDRAAENLNTENGTDTVYDNVTSGAENPGYVNVPE